MTDPNTDPDPEHPNTRRHRAGHLVRGIAIDLTPLRTSRDFRLLWPSEVITVTGQQISSVALLFQIYALTGSAAAVGLVGVFGFFPLLLGTVVGGPLIDRYDRRNLLLVTQTGLALSTGVLLAGALIHHPPLAMLYGAEAIGAFFGGIDVPTRSAMTPAIVGKDQLTAAIALNNVMWSVTTIAGPAIGGFLVGGFGLPWAYGLDLATSVVAVGLIAAIHHTPPEPKEDGQAQPFWDSLKEGLSYLKDRRVLKASFGIDLIAMIFGLPEALFPILAAEQFNKGPEVAGMLFASVAVGALIASLTSGWTRRIRHQGQAVVWAVIVWGAGITAFGLIGAHLWLAFALLALAGAADTVSAVFRATILQTSVTEELRGRLTSIHFLVVAGGPQIGYLESGLVAQIFSPMIAVVSGGVITMLGAIAVPLIVPEFWRYHAGEET